MKTKELRGLSSDELGQKEKAFKKDLFELNYQRKMGTVEKPARFQKIKKDIARILTILNEREAKDARDAKATQ